jgi:hypothetical protein
MTMAAPVRRPYRLLFLVGALAVFVAGVFVFAKPARSVTLLVPVMAGFVQAAPDVWVERGTNAETRDTVVRAVALAHQRLHGFYGAEAGRPIVLASTPIQSAASAYGCDRNSTSGKDGDGPSSRGAGSPRRERSKKATV